MGEAKRRRAAEAVLADHARGMRARHRDTVERLYDALAPAGRKLATLEILSVEAAVRRPGLAEPVLEAVTSALAVATGASTGPMAECFGCRAVWRPDLAPEAVLLTTIAAAGPQASLLSLLCRACATLPEAALRDRMLAGVRRDLMPDAGYATVSPMAGSA